MSRDELQSAGQVEAALLAYDEALRRGEVGSSEALGPQDLSPAERVEFRANQRFLIELEAMWPRARIPISLSTHRSALDESSRLAEELKADREQSSSRLSVRELKQAVVQSGILSEEELESALVDLGPERQPQCLEQLVYELIQRQILNRDKAGALCRRELNRLTLGPFQILDELGRGGMGIVYRAFDRRNGRYVALKMLRRRGRLREHLKREFRALSQIVHPNLVVLDQLRAEGDRWFFTMELIDGPNVVHFVRGTPEVARVQGGLRHVLRTRRRSQGSHSPSVCGKPRGNSPRDFVPFMTPASCTATSSHPMPW